MASTPEFLSVGVSTFLEADKRPTFVLDSLEQGDSSRRHEGLSEPILTNEAFQKLTGQSHTFSTKAWAAFYDWATCSAKQDRDHSETYEYIGRTWQRFNIERRWEVVSSSDVPREDVPLTQTESIPNHQIVTRLKRPLASVLTGSAKTASRAPSFDWTTYPEPSSLSEHVKFARNYDWASTSIGALETWSPQLRTMTNIVMLDPSPAVLFWGEELVAFYNEGYVNIAGSRHPALMGQPASVGWADIWDEYSIVYRKVWDTGESLQSQDTLFFLGATEEETYCTFTIIPVLGDDGAVTGCYQSLVVTTAHVLSHRRMSILLEVRHQTAEAESLKQYWTNLLASIEPNVIDLPFAVLYSVDTDHAVSEHSSSGSSTSTKTSMNSPTSYWLEGTVGISAEGLDVHFDTKAEIGGVAQIFRKAEAAGGYCSIDVTDEFWPHNALKEQDAKRGFGSVCKQATVHILRPSNGAEARGLLVLGVNSRQPFDYESKVFRQTLGSQIASSLASAVLFDDEKLAHQRRIKEAVTDKALLSQEILQRSRDTEVLENRFFRIAQLSPVAIFVTERNGSIIYVC